MRMPVSLKKMIAGLAMLRYKDAWLMPFPIYKSLIKKLKETSKGLRPLFKNNKIYLFASIPPLKTNAFKRYLKGMKILSKGKSLPLEVHISVTDKCGYNCNRCSNISNNPEPEIPGLKRIIEKFKNAGTASISFTGGEPGLRSDLHEIIKICADEISTTLYTTGQGIDKYKLIALKDNGLEKLYVSLDHYKIDIHNSGRKDEQAFQKAISLIENAKSLGIYTVAQAVISDILLNKEEVDKYLYYVNKLGVDEVMILEDIEVKQKTKQDDFEETEIKNYLIDLHIKCAQNQSYPRVSTMSFLERGEYAGCQAGFSFCYVNTAGEVFPCDFVPLSFGNIYTDSVEEIFNRFEELLKSPSRNCLARALQKYDKEQLNKPTSFKETKQILKNYSPGKPPGLMI